MQRLTRLRRPRLQPGYRLLFILRTGTLSKGLCMQAQPAPPTTPGTPHHPLSNRPAFRFSWTLEIVALMPKRHAGKDSARTRKTSLPHGYEIASWGLLGKCRGGKGVQHLTRLRRPRFWPGYQTKIIFRSGTPSKGLCMQAQPAPSARALHTFAQERKYGPRGRSAN